MKKFTTVLLSVFILLCCAACGTAGSSGSSSAADSPSEPAVSSSADSASKTESDGNKGEQQGKGKIKDYEVEIVSCTTTKDYSENDTALITYTFTNNSDEAASFMFAISAKAFQNGVELSDTLVDDESVDSGALLKEIQPGASLTFTRPYKIDSMDAEINVECTEQMNFSNNEEKVVKTFSLAE